MIFGDGSMLAIVLEAVMVILTVSLLCSLIRLIIGPTLPDRVVALDQFATLVVGVIAVYSIASQSPAMLRSAIVLALVSFLGTVAFARYNEKRGTR